MGYEKDTIKKPNASTVLHLFDTVIRKGEKQTHIRPAIRSAMKEHGLKKAAVLIGIDHKAMMNALEYFGMKPTKHFGKTVLEVARSGLDNGKCYSAREIATMIGEEYKQVVDILNKEAATLHAHASPRSAASKAARQPRRPSIPDSILNAKPSEVYAALKDDDTRPSAPYLFSV